MGLIDNVNVQVSGSADLLSTLQTYTTKVLKPNIVDGKNILTQEMVSAKNTKYVIKYDYELAEDITISENCVLEFAGGSLSNGTLVGNNTRINGNNNIFSAITINGTWICPVIKSNWFTDITSQNCIKQLFNFANELISNEIILDTATYKVTVNAFESAIIIRSNTIVTINGSIELESNNASGYHIIQCSGENIKLQGDGVIKGDAVGHDYSSGGSQEWGFGIFIDSTSKDVLIEGLNVSHCTGDGIYIEGENIIVSNVNIKKCRRQGITVGGPTKNVLIQNFVIDTIGDFVEDGVSVTGTNPKSGIDIEPNNTDVCENVLVKNGTISNCGLCAIFSCSSGENGAIINNIIVENIVVKQCTFAFRFESTKNIQVICCKSTETNIFVTTNNSDVIVSNCTIDSLYLTTNQTDSGNKNSKVHFVDCKINISPCPIVPCLILENCTITQRDNDTTNFFTVSNKLVLRNTSIQCINRAIIGKDSDFDNVQLIIDNCYIENQNNETIFARVGKESVIRNTIIKNNNAASFHIAVATGIVYAVDCTFLNPNGIEIGCRSYSTVDTLQVIYNEKFKVGSTRPSVMNTLTIGHKFFDTTLSPIKPIWWNGTAWVDATGQTV